MESNFLAQILSPNNETRQAAEKLMQAERQSNPAGLARTLLSGMQCEQPQEAMLAAVLYKKMFLDGDSAVAETDLEAMKQSIMSTIDLS